MQERGKLLLEQLCAWQRNKKYKIKLYNVVFKAALTINFVQSKLKHSEFTRKLSLISKDA